MTPPTPSIYRSRSKTTRQRVIFAVAGVALLLLGYAIGRLQGSGSPASGAAARPSVTPASAPPSETPSAAPESSDPPTEQAPGGTDAYAPLQAEAAAGQQGTQSEDTTGEGGGKDVGYINNGDWLRFDDVNFGGAAATKMVARVSSQSDTGGRMEIRVDTPSNAPVASLPMSNTGGWQNWQTRKVEMTPVKGLHTIFVTFANDTGDEFMNVNYFSFEH